MAGSYCKYCGHRCFVYRMVPNSTVTHLATCQKGAAHDREHLGYDYTTAYNPFDPEQAKEYERVTREAEQQQPIQIREEHTPCTPDS